MTSRLFLTACSLTLVFTSGQLGIAPKAEALLASEKAKADKTTQEVDLSGVWLQGDEEWQIRHNPRDGTITILDPLKHLPGRYVEYVGTIKGDTITATYRVTDPAVFNPQLPEKVRREHVKDQPTWSLKLRITKEGKLEGAKGQYRVSYNQKSLKINRVAPETKKITLAKKPSLKGPPDKPGEPSEEEARRRLAEEAQRQADELNKIAVQAAEARVTAEQRHQQAVQELERARQEHAEAEKRHREAEEAAFRAAVPDKRAAEELDAALKQVNRTGGWTEANRARLDEAFKRAAETHPEADRTRRQLQEAHAAEREALMRKADAAAQAGGAEYRLFEARRESERAEADARAAQRRANELRYGPDRLRDDYVGEPVPEPGRSPATPPTSPGAVRP